MKKYSLILIFFFFVTASFAQTVNTEVPITGLGEFRLGMSKVEVYELLSVLKTENIMIFSMESAVLVTNMELAGYIFNSCSLTFREEKLSLISFSKSFDKKNKFPMEFYELVSILENDYGAQPNKQTELKKENEEMSFTWKDKSKTLLFIQKSHDKKEKQNKIMIYTSSM